MRTKKGLWYFAHPYTVRDNERNVISEGQEANFRLCCQRSAELIKRGYLIYSPIAATHPIHISDPEFIRKQEYGLWIKLDNTLLANANFRGIILAPDWEKSEGCKDERNHFLSKGLEIKFYNKILQKEKLSY